MKAEIETFFAEDVSSFTRELAELDAQIAPSAEPQKDDRFRRLVDGMDRTAAACRRVEALLRGDPEELRQVQTRFQEEIAPWFDRSWFMHRARHKPRGYPGDYVLLGAIYDNVVKSPGIGSYLDLYFLQSTLGRAVRARLSAVRSFLIEELSRRRRKVSVLNVACGPCREYVGGIPCPENCAVDMTCIDNDLQALEFVQSHVARPLARGPEIRCARYNALRMSSARATIRRFGRCDVLYSVGLCDYIPDRYLVPLLRGWRDSLNDGGTLYIAFKDARRYDKTLYQWCVDWYFFQRTEDDCRELYRQAGFDLDALEMTRDETGVIMNFVSRARRPAMVRVHVPDGLVDEPAHAAWAPDQETSRPQPQ